MDPDELESIIGLNTQIDVWLFSGISAPWSWSDADLKMLEKTTVLMAADGKISWFGNLHEKPTDIL